MSNVVLVDGNNLFHAGWHTTQGLRDSRGRPTGAAVTFLTQLAGIRRTLKTNLPFLVAWDRTPEWRTLIYPEYKGNRDRSSGSDNSDFNWAKELLLEALPKMGVLQISGYIDRDDIRYGIEADDIASIYAHTGQAHILISSDKDWLQLIGAQPETQIYRQIQKTLVATPEQFHEATGYPTTEIYRKAKALTGESGDNIPGLLGIGPKTALKWLMNEKVSSAVNEKIDEWVSNPEGFNRSYKLFSLDIRDIPVGSIQYVTVDAVRDAKEAEACLSGLGAHQKVTNRLWEQVWW